jgi:hypothetical protein
MGFEGVPTTDVRELIDKSVASEGLLLVERISDQYETSLFNVNPSRRGCWAGCMTIHWRVVR